MKVSSNLITNIKLNLYNPASLRMGTKSGQQPPNHTLIKYKKYKITSNNFRLILNKPYDISIKQLHEIANIPTILEFITNSLTTAYHPHHQNQLISNTGDNQINNIPSKIRTRLPKHAITCIYSQDYSQETQVFENFLLHDTTRNINTSTSLSN